MEQFEFVYQFSIFGRLNENSQKLVVVERENLPENQKREQSEQKALHR